MINMSARREQGSNALESKQDLFGDAGSAGINANPQAFKNLVKQAKITRQQDGAPEWDPQAQAIRKASTGSVTPRAGVAARAHR